MRSHKRRELEDNGLTWPWAGLIVFYLIYLGWHLLAWAQRGFIIQ